MTGLAVLVALGALGALGVWRFRWLTSSGGLASLAVGAAVLAGAGVAGLGLLLFFFVSSSLLTGWRSAEKAVARRRRAGGGAGDDGRGRSARRDGRGRSAGQVVANGGVAAVASLLHLAGWTAGAQLALVGALAAATADTWATEVGTAGGWPTRRIVGWAPVIPGTSGGVSLPGTVAGAAGALLCGACAALLFDGGATGPVLAGLAGGLAGMVADSVLGATAEARATWVTNDVVNLAGTLVGGAVGWALVGALPA